MKTEQQKYLKKTLLLRTKHSRLSFWTSLILRFISNPIIIVCRSCVCVWLNNIYNVVWSIMFETRPIVCVLNFTGPIVYLILEYLFLCVWFDVIFLITENENYAQMFILKLFANWIRCFLLFYFLVYNKAIIIFFLSLFFKLCF